MVKLDKEVINTKKKALEDVAMQLKSEFFGLDEVIDKVIKSINAWYIFPEIITRPVIINLWGMTGVGKTQLVRRLASLLRFHDRFVEVQMDGGSMKSAYSSDMLSRILSESSIEEGTPGILLLDEIQRFKTIDNTGSDIKVERFHDVWTLLSDGKFSADASMFQEIEMMIAAQEYYKDYNASVQHQKKEDEDNEDALVQKMPRQFKIYPYEAKALKKTLRLTESVQEIMRWDTSRVSAELDKLRIAKTAWEIDYSKLVIFISGNLDRAFVGSGSAEDCDTDADFYHEETKKISISDIKTVLGTQFRPEQISRLGNNHIIYPSMSKKSYKQLIEKTVEKYIVEMEMTSGIKFSVDDTILDEIYSNSVFPTQGTRPVFSSIHLIFSSILSNVTFWSIENDHAEISMTMSGDHKGVVATGDNLSTETFATFPISLEINEKKLKATIDFKTYVAVHEAGHAVVYSKLTKNAPKEIKINVASFNGGYMLPQSTSNDIVTAQMMLNKIATFLGGRCAEEIVFGNDESSTGAEQDIASATAVASSVVRHHGHGKYVSRVSTKDAPSLSHTTFVDETDCEIERILKQEKSRAASIIKENFGFFQAIVDQLIKSSYISQDDFIALARDYDMVISKPEGRFSDAWNSFKFRNRVI